MTAEAREAVDSNSVTIGGLNIGALSRASWADLIATECKRQRRRLGSEPPAFFTSANGNVVSLYARSAPFRMILDSADGIDADGMPLVLASQLSAQNSIPERCCTTDFVHDMADVAVREDLSFYLLGGTTDTSRRAAEALTERHKGLKIAGSKSGYFAADEEESIVREINDAAPDILWVGLGVPKEHEFVARNRKHLGRVGTIKTCGGLFDYLSSNSKRAPRWMQDYCLEWLYRFVNEPRRLGRRYLLTNLHSLILLLTRTRRQKLMQKKGSGD